MTKLIVHIGYPKTATSSLQKNVLIPLHQHHRLNYLGEETIPAMGELHHDSKFVKNLILGGPDELKFAYCVPSDDLDHYRVNRIDPSAKLLRTEGALKPFVQDGMVNILSYETLLMPYRAVVNWKGFPRRLHDALPAGKGDVQIVVTLRNQASLMESFFVEKSLGYYLRSPFATPRQLYFDEGDGLSLRDCEQVNIFDFVTTLAEYETIFGRENIHILFYEDIETHPGDYFDAWARLLGIAASEISDLFNGRPKARVSRADKDHLKLRVSGFDHLTRRKAGARPSGLSGLGKATPRPFTRRILDAVRRLPLVSRWKVEVSIPKLTAPEKAAIHDHFKASNAEAARIYGLDLQKMKKYGYL